MATLLKVGGDYENYGFAHKEWLVEDENDRDTIDITDLAPGSIARTAGCSKIWELSPDKEWTPFG